MSHVTAGHAFICYSREDDSEKVDWLQRVLEGAGVLVWRDTDQIWPGQHWEAVVRDAIRNDSLAFIACFSRAALARKKGYRYAELNLAVEQMRLMRSGDPWFIPTRFDDCAIPDVSFGAGLLSSIQRVDLFGPDRERQARLLAKAVLRILSQA